MNQQDFSYGYPMEGGRKAVIDVGLDGSPVAVDLDVDSKAVERGLEMVGQLLEFADKEPVSDIHFRTDRHVYANTVSGPKIIEEYGRLNSSQVAGVLLALVYNRNSAIAMSRNLQKHERESLSRALTLQRKVDFSCEGGDTAAFFGSTGEASAMKRGRMRVQAHFSSTGLGITCRLLRENILSLEETGLPSDVIASLTKLVQKKSGLALVTGATGSGKTTTLAALIEWVRRNLRRHIVTIEDPIEFHYRDSVSLKGGKEVPSNTLITQQEVGRDVLSFKHGIHEALRKKPDIILLGEIRDGDTMEACMEAAQTGHLVLSTLHTRGAARTLSRIMEFFPAEWQPAALKRLSETLLFILSQGLLPPEQGDRYVLAVEYLRNASISTRSAIAKYYANAATLEDELPQSGNVSWESSLQNLYSSRLISQETLREFSVENKTVKA
jgi:twitching motility protein PilT